MSIPPGIEPRNFEREGHTAGQTIKENSVLFFPRKKDQTGWFIHSKNKSSESLRAPIFGEIADQSHCPKTNTAKNSRITGSRIRICQEECQCQSGCFPSLAQVCLYILIPNPIDGLRFSPIQHGLSHDRSKPVFGVGAFLRINQMPVLRSYRYSAIPGAFAYFLPIVYL